MKIIKIELTEDSGIITVYTEDFPELGFGFEIDSIADRNNLNAKVTERVNKEKANESEKNARRIKFENIR